MADLRCHVGLTDCTTPEVGMPDGHGGCTPICEPCWLWTRVIMCHGEILLGPFPMPVPADELGRPLQATKEQRPHG